jgi:hypothetical protein
MNTQTKPTATYDPAALYAKWTESARDTRWRYRGERVSEFNAAEARAKAWSDGAASVYVVDDLAAYLIEQMRGLDSTAKDARVTYADMLNDIHASTSEVAELRATVARLEAELAAATAA